MGKGRDVKLEPHLRWDVGSVVISCGLQGEVDGRMVGNFGMLWRVCEPPPIASRTAEWRLSFMKGINCWAGL